MRPRWTRWALPAVLAASFGCGSLIFSPTGPRAEVVQVGRMDRGLMGSRVFFQGRLLNQGTAPAWSVRVTVSVEAKEADLPITFRESSTAAAQPDTLHPGGEGWFRAFFEELRSDDEVLKIGVHIRWED